MTEELGQFISERNAYGHLKMVITTYFRGTSSHCGFSVLQIFTSKIIIIIFLLILFLNLHSKL